MLPYEGYISVCLITAVNWAYLGQTWSRRTLSLVVFFPGIFIAWFGEEASFLSRVIGFNKFNACIQFAVLGGILSMAAISLCLLVNWLTGWGKIDDRAKYEESSMNLPTVFLSCAAEEIGWRCYLLPLLVKDYGNIYALVISATLTGLFHVPNMYVIAKHRRIPHPLHLAFLVFCQRFLMSFPTGWIAIKSGYLMWGPMMLLLTWSRINPATTGNLYTNYAVKIKGPLWLVSGQGVAGCIGLIPVVLVVLYDLVFRDWIPFKF